MPASPNAGPSSAKSEEDCLKILAQEVTSLKDREVPSQDQPSSSRPAGSSSSSGGGRTSSTDAMIIRNIREAMKDLKPKP